jgi:hypothetical protein
MSPLDSRDAGPLAFKGWNGHAQDPQNLSYYTLFIVLLSTDHFRRLWFTCADQLSIVTNIGE